MLGAQEASGLEYGEPDGETDEGEMGGCRGQTQGPLEAEGSSLGLFLGYLEPGRQGPISLPGPR